MAEFIVKLGDQVLQTRKFEGELLRIGRSRENDIVLENLSVSREHAHIRFHNDQFILTDLNSANGTLVNGIKVTKTELVDEDVITIGKHKLHFRNPVLSGLSPAGQDADELHTVMLEPKAESWLSVESGRLKGREFKIVRFETSLGKAATNDVVITDDWLLSKKQAIILRKRNNAFELQDLGGLRKTKINGIAVSDKVELKANDVIEIGGTKLVFHSGHNVAPPVTDGQPKPEGSKSRPSLSRAPALSKPDSNSKEGLAPAFEELNQSLDLEEGFHSFRINLQDESLGGDASEKVPDNEAVPAPAEEPAVVAASSAAQEVVTNRANGSQPAFTPAQPPVPNAGAFAHVESSRNHMFEDQRSHSRRKRKAQQRNKKSGSDSKSTASKATARPEKIVSHPTDIPNEKEVSMWEEALKNPSPAIQRQAARMLKKLTGRDYDL